MIKSNYPFFLSWVVSKRSLPNWKPHLFSPTFFPEVLFLAGFTFCSMIYYVCAARYVSKLEVLEGVVLVFLFCLWFPIVSASIIEKTIFSSLNCLYTFVKKSTDHICVSVFLYSVPLIHLSILMPILHCLYYCGFIISLEVR